MHRADVVLHHGAGAGFFQQGFSHQMRRNSTAHDPRISVPRLHRSVKKEVGLEDGSSSGGEDSDEEEVGAPKNRSRAVVGRTTGTTKNKSKSKLKEIYLSKFFDLVSDSASDAVVWWSKFGTHVFVQEGEAIMQVLKNAGVGRSDKYGSFKRQMTYYKFTKLRLEKEDNKCKLDDPAVAQEWQRLKANGKATDVAIFYHQFFMRGRKDLLGQVESATLEKKKKTEEATPSCGSMELEEKDRIIAALSSQLASANCQLAVANGEIERLRKRSRDHPTNGECDLEAPDGALYHNPKHARTDVRDNDDLDRWLRDELGSFVEPRTNPCLGDLNAYVWDANTERLPERDSDESMTTNPPSPTSTLEELF